MNISGKVAVITGASSGIGLATATLLAAGGAKVVLAARSTEKLQKLSQKLPNSLAVATDMTRMSDIQNLVHKTKQHFGRLDILINNAGQGYDADIEEIDVDIYRKLFELNVIGPLVAMQQVIPLLKIQKSGCIVNISSGTALMALPGMSPYSSLKRALVGLSLTAREELKKYHICVSVVYPYITHTDFEKNTISAVTDTNKTGDGPPFPPDTPEHVAKKILMAIDTTAAEIFAHDWMQTKV
jgi:short-subunit dehydrogenase